VVVPPALGAVHPLGGPNLLVVTYSTASLVVSYPTFVHPCYVDANA
jgi:hypothetical protein